MIHIAPHITQALSKGLPVVALESTIISHGMPYPQNVETALSVEEEIRQQGAIPATIGIIDGVAIVGMSKEEIEAFGQKKNIVKVSRRDLPIVFAQKLWGATTVAATMILAEKAGIEVFVTGGIGGVHREAAQTMDISADLQELARTNVSVVCAGAKAILDIGLTLEYLETYGVPVIGYQTEYLPAFYTRKSHYKVDVQLDTPEQIARVIQQKRALHLVGGVLITNPIPMAYSLDEHVMNTAIDQALVDMKKNHIIGKDQTPFLLKRVTELTGGESLKSNVALIKNNARLGAHIAIALSHLHEGGISHEN